VEYFVVGILAIVALCVFSGLFASSITNALGFAYPAYASIKAVETPSKNDDKQWLTYWVVFAAFCMLENFIDYILYWVPFYYAIKLAFLIWCMIPKYEGATVVYTTLIRPAFLKHESAIDSALSAIDPSAVIDAAVAAKNSAVSGSTEQSAAAAADAEPEVSSTN